MAATYFISRNNKMMGRFDSTEKIKALLESNATWPADTYNIVEKSDDLAAGYKDRPLGHCDQAPRWIGQARARWSRLRTTTMSVLRRDVVAELVQGRRMLVQLRVGSRGFPHTLVELLARGFLKRIRAVGQAVAGDLPEEDAAETFLHGPFGLERDRLGIVVADDDRTVAAKPARGSWSRRPIAWSSLFGSRANGDSCNRRAGCRSFWHLSWRRMARRRRTHGRRAESRQPTGPRADLAPRPDTSWSIPWNAGFPRAVSKRRRGANDGLRSSSSRR